MDQILHIDEFKDQIKRRSDRLMNFFLLGHFITGLILASFYDTWLIAIGVGGLSLLAFYSAKILLPGSNLYQYVISAIMGIFMAQYIYQMHGLFEMHFLAFIGSAMLITYQNWKLQFPLMFVVIIHHAVFGYLQFIGIDKIYFTQLDYMDLQTFIIHITLAAVVFYICGLWAYQFKKYNQRHIELTYQMARLQEAEIQKEALKKANMELDKFVYSVSHDLRAPLSSMKGIIEISEEETQDELLLKNFGILKGSVKKLDDFIQEILEYSRNSRMETKKQEIDFKDMLDDITSNLKYMSSNNQRKIDFKIDINNQSIFISDKSRISILLNNLISNAIRYQDAERENPFVGVTINMTDIETGIIVNDNGIGISKENQEKIFEMFYRISENSAGTGLGLYLVKDIVDKLNGKIEIRSELGIGTTFHILLPNNFNNN